MATEKKEEKLSLKNYNSILPKEQLKLSQKNPVRECDETPQNTFVAYVDEGDDTYDVSLTFSPTGEVLKDTCDCKFGTTFCRHKTALLVHVAGNKKVMPTTAVKKLKLSKSGALLADIGFDELKTWVTELLVSNKDIELGFIHKFESKNHEYTVDEVIKITEEATRAVVKSKKNIDQTQLKKIIDLWKKIHQPILEQYHAHIAEKNYFLMFNAIWEYCKKLDNGIAIKSSKITKYTEGLIAGTLEPINRLVQDEAYLSATSHFISNTIFLHSNIVNAQYLSHLKIIADTASEDRKTKLVQSIRNHYGQIKPDAIYDGSSYTKFLFALMEECKFPISDYAIFTPIRFDNNFNEKLINQLIENQKYAQAEAFCNDQIRGNFREEFNIPYFILLKKIHTLSGNEKKLIGIKILLLPFTYSFEDYIYIYNSMTDGDDKKNWRTKILAKIKNAVTMGDKDAQKFFFELHDHEKNYSKMIGLIGSYTRYSLIHKYFEPMAAANKSLLLKALITKNDSSSWGRSDGDKEETWYPEIHAGLLRHFTTEYLLAALADEEKKRVYYRLNSLCQFIQSNLKPQLFS